MLARQLHVSNFCTKLHENRTAYSIDDTRVTTPQAAARGVYVRPVYCVKNAHTLHT